MDLVDPESLPPEILAKLREHLPPTDPERSRLVRVIPIGQVAEVSDVRVELIAMEVRETGALVYWKAFPAQDRLLGEIDLGVSDALGTAYAAYGMAAAGNGHVWKGEAIVIPAPPPEARTIRVRVRGFRGFMASPFEPIVQTPVEGEWDFEIRA
jgi:hypothetical protein